MTVILKRRNILRVNKMKLSFEVKDLDNPELTEVAVCFDDEGLDLLIKKLSWLKYKKDHLHLMTPSWAGNELSPDKCGGADYSLINHVRLVKF
jgi:Immunity protein 32